MLETSSEKGARWAQDNLQVIDHPAAAAAALHSLALPSFLPFAQLQIRGKSGWKTQMVRPLQKIFDLLLFLILRMPLISTTAARLQLLPPPPLSYPSNVFRFSLKAPTACNAQISLELFASSQLPLEWHIEKSVNRSLTAAKLSHKRPTCQTRPEIHTEALEIQR